MMPQPKRRLSSLQARLGEAGYVKIVMLHLGQNELALAPGRIHHLELHHQDRCAFHNSNTAADCDCTPVALSGPCIDRKWSAA
jgi:hypothetical protein